VVANTDGTLMLSLTQITRGIGPEQFLHGDSLSIPLQSASSAVVRELDGIRSVFALVAIVGAAYTKDINVAVFWITIAVAGISFHAPVGWSIPGLIAPHNSTGQVGGIMNALNNVANFFAPVVTGYIVAQSHSFYAALITAGVILIFGIFSYTVILGRIDKVPEPA